MEALPALKVTGLGNQKTLETDSLSSRDTILNISSSSKTKIDQRNHLNIPELRLNQNIKGNNNQGFDDLIVSTEIILPSEVC